MQHTFEAPVKDPQSILRHSMDWSDWLSAGEAISEPPLVTSSVPSELVIDQVAQANGLVSWRVSGGNAGKNYLATCRVTTTLGRTEERSVRYRVRNR